MATFRFERECRTPYSEAYFIFRDDERVGRIDLHFTATIVHAGLVVGETFTDEDIQEIIETVDEQLVMSTDVLREDFIVEVFQGRGVGIYSDQGLEEEEEDGEDHQ